MMTILVTTVVLAKWMLNQVVMCATAMSSIAVINAKVRIARHEPAIQVIVLHQQFATLFVDIWHLKNRSADE